MTTKRKKTMSKETEEDQRGHAGVPRSWLGDMGGAIIWPLMAKMTEVIEAMDTTKRAFQLAPGDIIRVGHLHIYVMAIQLIDSAHPQSTHHQGVQLAGSVCEWKHHDWVWRAGEIMKDSPFLLFHPLDKLEVVRKAPDRISTLEQFRKFAAEAKKEDAEEIAKAKKEDADKAKSPPEDSPEDDSDESADSSEAQNTPGETNAQPS